MEKKVKKSSIFLKASIFSIILLFSSCTNLTVATTSISNVKEVTDFLMENHPIDFDEVLLYIWGPVSEGEEIFSTKDHILDAPEKGYVFYIDLYPKTNLFHPVQYIFISESTDKLIVKDAISPPLNFADYQMIETLMGELFISVQNRRAPIPESEKPLNLNGRSDRRYAVLMNGGHSAGSNHIRYWNDLSNIYITLNYVYGYPDENIIVLCSDGLDSAPDQSNGQNSDPDLDGDGDDDIMYSCILSNVDIVFEELIDILTESSELFVFATDHGSSYGEWDTLFNLWNMEELTDAHFAELLDALPDCEIVCTFEPCFSGGFLDNVVVPPGPVVASSACRHDEYSWAMSNLEYDEYVFHWTAAVKGEDAYGAPVDADFNEDGFITMDEAFIYAEDMDAQPESPQYGDYPENIGKEITLWPGSEPPVIPTKPNGPDIWAQFIDTSFSSITTDPEGESIFYWFEWGDGANTGWIGPYASGQTGEASHNWTVIGEYEIKVKAKDINDVESEWSEPAMLTIVENQPPEKPKLVDGSLSGPQKTLMHFTFSAEDPEGNDVSYMVSWGDGNYEPWTELKPSGTEVTFSHAWSEENVYTINIRAKDQYGAKSLQASFRLTITRSKNVIITPVIFNFYSKILYAFPILARLIERLLPNFYEKLEKSEAEIESLEEEKPSAPTEPDNQEVPILFEIFVEEEFKLGDPIPVIASITNIGDKTIWVSEMNLKTGTLDFFIKTPHGYTLQYIGQVNENEMKICSLRPQESKSYNIEIVYSGLFGMDPPGYSDMTHLFKEGGFLIKGHYKSFLISQTGGAANIWEGELDSQTLKFMIFN